MTIKLKGSTDGSVSLQSPADTSPTGTDITLTLPTTAGSANEFIKNSGTAGTLEYSSMVETSTGVGIGTSSPSTPLHISDTAAATGFSETLLRLDRSNFGGEIGGYIDQQVSHGMTFSVVDSGNATERARLRSTGELCVGTTSNLVFNSNTESGIVLDGANGAIQAARQNEASLFVNRQGNDGTLAAFYQAGNFEGSISVSGTTVSYNGGHLSRWSQLAGGAERTEILRGSVLSNLDEMCEWGEEDNEQLNRMKVSDVEGDVNVAGVFQSWDDDDDTYTNDFYCAMTGDFVIRIAQGTTVARGDLLMSAGDGTAKPQDDDIVRSKTIAKVTSTVVSETYADGSYCVPCVLMAC